MDANRSTDLVSRLRARRDVRDHSANNGWRNVEAPALEVEAAAEIERLSTIIRSVNRIISQNENYRWKVERIVAALGETS